MSELHQVDKIPYNRLAFDTNEAAKMIGVSKQTLDLMRTKNEGPDYVRIGRRILYTEASLVEYLHKNLVRVDQVEVPFA